MRSRIGSPPRGGEGWTRWAPALLAAALLWPGWLAGQGTTVAETYRAAYDNGFRDGSAWGREDRKQEGRYDLANKIDFQKADRGFVPSRHDREVYTVAYRRGFEDGYEKGYGLTPERPAAAPASTPPAAGDVAPPAPAAIPPVPAPAAAAAGGTVPAGAEIRLELLTPLSTRFNERGDPFRARVAESVVLDGALLIPRGSEVTGSISRLKRAGRIRGRAEMSLRFERIRLPDGRDAALEAVVVGLESPGEETVQEGEGAIVAASGVGSDTRKVGASAGLAGLIGLIAGGKRGAGAGAAAGAVAGLANVLISRGRDAHLESRTRLTIRLTQPLELASP